LLQIPSELHDAFISAADKGNIRTMPNRSMPADPHPTPGALLMGDAFNMRHPLTGGGMTVALSDIVVLRDLLKPLRNLNDAGSLSKYLESFYTLRKVISFLDERVVSIVCLDFRNMRFRNFFVLCSCLAPKLLEVKEPFMSKGCYFSDFIAYCMKWLLLLQPVASTINTLAGALYKVFSASPDQARKELRQACFDYLSLGGSFSTGPVALLSGLNPRPLSLVLHFFAVAIYGVGRLLLPFPSPKRMWIGARLISVCSFYPFFWLIVVDTLSCR